MTEVRPKERGTAGVVVNPLLDHIVWPPEACNAVVTSELRKPKPGFPAPFSEIHEGSTSAPVAQRCAKAN